MAIELDKRQIRNGADAGQTNPANDLSVQTFPRSEIDYSNLPDLGKENFEGLIEPTSGLKYEDERLVAAFLNTKRGRDGVRQYFSAETNQKINEAIANIEKQPGWNGSIHKNLIDEANS